MASGNPVGVDALSIVSDKLHVEEKTANSVRDLAKWCQEPKDASVALGKVLTIRGYLLRTSTIMDQRN